MSEIDNNNGDMPLLDHLSELRSRLRTVLIVNIIAMMVLFQYTEEIMRYLFNLNPGMQLVYISPSELLLVYVQVALLVAVVLCSPITIYQLWAFLQKGLHAHEKRRQPVEHQMFPIRPTYWAVTLPP